MRNKLRSPPPSAEMVANIDATAVAQPLLQNRKRNDSIIKQIEYHKVLIKINLKLFRTLGVSSLDSKGKKLYKTNHRSRVHIFYFC